MPDPTPSETSASLLERVRQSPADPVAWGEFVDRYGLKIYRWCLRWNLQPADAEDVTQTVLLKLTEKMRNFTYDPSRSFRAWLKTVTHHAWRDYVDGLGPAERIGKDIQALLENQQAADDLDAYLDEEHRRTLLEEARCRVQKRVEPTTWEAFVLLTVEQRRAARWLNGWEWPSPPYTWPRAGSRPCSARRSQRLEARN